LFVALSHVTLSVSALQTVNFSGVFPHFIGELLVELPNPSSSALIRWGVDDNALVDWPDDFFTVLVTKSQTIHVEWNAVDLSPFRLARG
jgi:hypothetical protein